MSDWSIEREKEAHSQIEALRSDIEGYREREKRIDVIEDVLRSAIVWLSDRVAAGDDRMRAIELLAKLEASKP